MKLKMTLEGRKSMWGYLFILPWIIGFLFFFAAPLVQSIQFSFSDVRIDAATGFTTKFIKFKNFTDAFTVDAKFPLQLWGAVQKMLTDVPIILVFSFFAAVLLKEKFIGNSTAKAVFFLPVILVSGVFLKMSAQTANNAAGLNAAMTDGSAAIQFFQGFQLRGYLISIGLNPTWVGYIMGPVNKIFSIISQSGIQLFIFLAGLHGISPSIFEACYIEGATGWETFWKITFPMITPLLLVNTVYTVVDSFTSYSNTCMSYIYGQGLGGALHFGYSSALSWIYFLAIGSILGLITLWASKRIYYSN